MYPVSETTDVRRHLRYASYFLGYFQVGVGSNSWKCMVVFYTDHHIILHGEPSSFLDSGAYVDPDRVCRRSR